MLLPLVFGFAAASPALPQTVPDLTVVGSGAIGSSIQFVATGMTSLPPIPELLVVDAGTLPAPIGLEPFGDFYLAGTSALFTVPGDGTFNWIIDVPADPALIGTSLFAQALGLVFEGFEGDLKLSTLASVTLTNQATVSRFAAIANIGDGTIGFLGVGENELRHVGYDSSPSLPQALAAAPDGEHLYVADVGASAVQTLAFDVAEGKWSPVASTPAGSGPSAIAISNSGGFLYVANAASDDISQFRLDAAGVPQPLSPPSVPGGVRPTALDVSPTGNWLFSLAGNSNQVGAYAIAPGTGELTLTTAAFVDGNPADLVSNEAGDRIYVLRRSAGTVRALIFDGAAPAFTAVPETDVSVGFGATSIDLDPTGRWLYVADAAGATVQQFAVDPGTGALQPTPVATAITGLGPVKLRVDSTGECLIVLCGGINEAWVYDLDPVTGAPNFAQRLRQRVTPVDVVFVPGEAAVNFRSRLLLAGHRDSDEVRRYQLDAPTGTLIDLGGGISTTGLSPRGLALDRLSGHVATANFTGQSVSSFELNVDNGNLASQGDTFGLASPFDVAMDPSGRFVWASESGADALATLALVDGAQPTVVDSEPMPPLSIPRGIAIDPTGQILLATGSLTDRVHAYRASTADGRLSPIGAAEVNGAPYDLVFHPEGRFAYVLTRSNKRVRALTIDPVSGAPTLLSGISAQVGAGPEALAIDPTGRFLYCANAGDDNISAFAIDPLTAALTPLGTTGVADDPRGLAVDASGSVLVVANTSAGLLQVFDIDPATGALDFSAMFASNGLGPLGLAVTNEFD